MFINVADRAAAEKQLMQYLDRGEIERLFANQTIKFEEKQEVGIASVVIIIDISRLIIEGQGIGIPESDLAHIFQPFYRASNVGAVSGKGVGLALSKSILQRMGATIAVTSSIDSGTTFTITFPLNAFIVDRKIVFFSQVTSRTLLLLLIVIHLPSSLSFLASLVF